MGTILAVIEVYQNPILPHTHTQKGKTLILVQRHEKIQKSKETIDSNDTLECDDEAHKVVLSTHSHFF